MAATNVNLEDPEQLQMRIEEAVLVCLSPAADPGRKEAALRLCEDLKSVPSGWRNIMRLYTREPSALPEIQFFCIQLFEGFIQDERFALEQIDQFRREWFNHLTEEQLMRGRDLGPTYLRNKIAQLLVQLGIRTYPAGWPEMFQSMLGWLMRSPNGPVIDMFLRLSLALNEQLTNRAPVISDLEHARNIAFKDAMRMGDIGQMVQAWQQLLQMIGTDGGAGAGSDGEGVVAKARMLLQILAGYTEWIDVGMVATPALLSLVYGHLQSPRTRCEAVHCLTAIVAKGMPVGEKYKLITYLNLVSVFEGATTNDPEWYAAICRLLAVTGGVLAEGMCIGAAAAASISTDHQSSPSYDPAILAFIEDRLLPNAIRILWGASPESVISLCPFFIGYFDLLKVLHFAKDGLSDKQTGLLASLLEPVIRKARLPLAEASDTDEDEDAFAESRHCLEPVYDHIVTLASHRATLILHAFVMGVLDPVGAGNVDGSDLEVALYLLYRYSEAMKGHPVFQITINRVTELTSFGQMVTTVIESAAPRLATHPHPAIVQHYFEIGVRYGGSGYFERFPQGLPPFIDRLFGAGLGSPHPSVRIRCGGLLYKLVKQGRDKFFDPAMADHFIGRASELIGRWLGDEEGGKEGEREELESRHHVLEALGILFTLPRGEKNSTVVEPVSLVIGNTIDAIGNPQDPSGFARLSFALKTLASVGKGVSEGGGRSSASLLASGSGITLAGRLQFPQHIERLQRYLSPPYAPVLVFATQRFLSLPECNVTVMLDFLVRFGASGQADRAFLVDLLAMLAAASFRLKQTICPVLAGSWLPLQQVLLGSWSARPEGTDDQVRQSEMRHKYSALLLAMFAASNMIGEMFAQTGNVQACLELAFLSLYSAVENSAEQSSSLHYPPQSAPSTSASAGLVTIDGPLLRTTYSIVIKMLKFALANHPDLRMAVLEYVQRTFLPATLTLPLLPAFALRDAPSQSVITEFCQLHRLLWEIHGGGPVYGQLMQQVFARVPQANALAESNAVGEFVAAVSSITDLKDIRGYFTNFFESWRRQIWVS